MSIVTYIPDQTVAYDALGIRESGARLFFYEFDTTTPVPVYQDPEGVTPAANPLPSLSDGTWPQVYWNNATRTRVVKQSPVGSVAPMSWQVDEIGISLGTLAETFILLDGSNAAGGAFLLKDGSNVDMTDDQTAAFREAISVDLYFPTIADASASDVGSDVGSFTIGGYYVEGDFESPVRVARSTGALVAGKIQTADGAFWDIASFPIPSAFLGADPSKSGSINSAALNAVLVAAERLKAGVEIKPGVYALASTVEKLFSRTCPNISSSGVVVLDSTAFAGVALKISGDSGYLANATIQNITFKASVSAGGRGMQIAGQCGVNVENCSFPQGNGLAEFYNELAGQFTEFCVFRNCDFGYNPPAFHLQYRVGAGDASFNGSGFFKCRINWDATGADTPAGIIVGAGALIYDAPWDGQIWVRAGDPATAAVKYLFQNNSSLPVQTYGNLTIELVDSAAQAGHLGHLPRVFGGSGEEIIYAGDIETLGTVWLADAAENASLLGNLSRRIGAEGGAAEGSLTQRKTYTSVFTLGAGATTLVNIAGAGKAQVDVQITNNPLTYDVRSTLVCFANGYAASGVVSKPVVDNNVAGPGGTGAPVFTVNAAGDLIVTNANYTSAFTAALTVIEGGPFWNIYMYTASTYLPTGL